MLDGVLARSAGRSVGAECWTECWRGCCSFFLPFARKAFLQHPCQHSGQHPKFLQHSSQHPSLMNKHKQLFRIIPVMGSNLFMCCLYVGERGKHINKKILGNLRKMPGLSRDYPGDNPVKCLFMCFVVYWFFLLALFPAIIGVSPFHYSCSRPARFNGHTWKGHRAKHPKTTLKLPKTP